MGHLGAHGRETPEFLRLLQEGRETEGFHTLQSVCKTGARNSYHGSTFGRRGDLLTASRSSGVSSGIWKER